MNSDRCPRCGSLTIVRISRGGWTPGTKFVGCADWPACRFSAPIPSKWDIERDRQMSFLREIFWKPRFIYLRARWKRYMTFPLP